jgi:uncharacterized membrane protein YozB (DUF420 family)
MIFFLFLGTTESINAQEIQPKIEIIINVNVIDVDLTGMSARVIVRLQLLNFPNSASNILINIVGYNYPTINCSYIGAGQYAGISNELGWFIDGIGDMFPYDSYSLHFKIDGNIRYISNNITYYLIDEPEIVINEYSTAYFEGMKAWLLKDTWESSSLVLPFKISNSTFDVFLIRRSYAPSLLFIAPFLLSELIMLSCILLNPRIDHQLSLYTALIVFSPLNTLAIQQFLPHRRIMSLPEFYSLFVFITSILLIIRTISLKKKPQKKVYSFLNDSIYLIIIFVGFYSLFNQIYNPIINEQVRVSVIYSVGLFYSIIIGVAVLRIGVYVIEDKNNIKNGLKRIQKKIANFYNQLKSDP